MGERVEISVLLVHPDPGVAAAIRSGTQDSPYLVVVEYQPDAAAILQCPTFEHDLVIVGGEHSEIATAAVRNRDLIVPLVLLVDEQAVERIAWRHGIDMFVREPVLVIARWQTIVIDAILRKSSPRAGTDVVHSEWEDALTRVLAVRERRRRMGDLSHAADTLTQAVAERERVAQALAQAAKDYRAIFDAYTDAKVVVDPVTFDVVDYNLAASRTFSCPAEAAHACVAECFKGVEGGMRKIVDRAMAGIDAVTEHQMCMATGQQFWVEIVAARVELSGVDRVVLRVRNIEHRHRSDAMLRSAVHRYNMLFARLPTAIIELNRDATVAMVNPAAEILLDHNWLSISGKPVSEVLGEEAGAAISKALSDGDVNQGFSFLIRDQETAWRLISEHRCSLLIAVPCA